MTSYIGVNLRRLVASRAKLRCEFCLIHQDVTFYGCHVDHIVAEKHGGRTVADNLAYACTFCNRSKGSDIGSIADSTGEYTRFFNPRTDRWADHFLLNRVNIESRTPIGEVTAAILRFNSPDRIRERQVLQTVGRYPPPDA